MSVLRYRDPVTGKMVPIQSIRGDDGNQMFVRYSVYPDGTDMSETWDETMVYMGIALAPVNAAPTDKAEYQWIRASSTKTFKGSYVGTGVSGSSKANSLTFDFAPKVLIITRSIGSGVEHAIYNATVDGSGYSMFRLSVDATISGNVIATNIEQETGGRYKLTWYVNSSSPHEQMNYTQTYYYTAIE